MQEWVVVDQFGNVIAQGFLNSLQSCMLRIFLMQALN